MGFRAGALAGAVWVLAFAAGAQTLHLKNGKTLEGKVLGREADRIWLDTPSGRVPVPLARIEPGAPGMLEEAEGAFQAGAHRKALRLGQIVLFWEPENEEAARLIERAENQIQLAARGRELTAREQAAEDELAVLSERLEQIGDAEADPAGVEAALARLEGEIREAAGTHGGTPSESGFQALLEETAARSLAAHELRLQKEAREALDREREARRMRAEAMGIRDFLAPVSTLNNGGKTVDLETLMVPGGVMIFDFYADWCEPCRRLDPQLRELAQQQENVYLRRINILNWDTAVARQYHLTSIPSVWVYDGEGDLVEARLNGLEAIRAAVIGAGARSADHPRAEAPGKTS